MIPEILVAENGEQAEALALLFNEGEPVFTGRVAPDLAAQLEQHARIADFTGKKDSLFKLPLTGDGWRVIYLAGLGDQGKISSETYRQ
ncbi:MAG: M17 family peptidase N-terminal domain-containing protein, partial [Methanomassiliicoccales archaeon]